MIKEKELILIQMEEICIVNSIKRVKKCFSCLKVISVIGGGIIPAVLVYTKDFVSMIKEKSTMTKEIKCIDKQILCICIAKESNCTQNRFKRVKKEMYILK